MKPRKLFFIAVILFIASLPALAPVNSIMERAVTLANWKYYDDAIIECDRLIPEGKEPWSSRAEFLKAWCLYKKGSYEKAVSIFTDLLTFKDFALHDYAKLYIGDSYMEQKKYTEAILTYKEIFRDSAVWPESVIKRAECMENLGDLNNAMEACKALILEGSNIAPLDKARMVLGRCQEKTGNYKGAMKTYHEVNLYHPLSPLAKEATAKINSISRRYKIYPGAASAEELFNKAMVFYNFGDFNSANMFFNKIIVSYRTSPFWEDAVYKAGMCDYKKRRLRASINRFKVLVQRGGDYAPSAQFYMAFAYGKSGYFYQALECLNKVVVNYPTSQFADDAAYYLGYYYEANNFKDAGLKYYESFIANYPASEFLAEAYWRAGRLYYFKKDYQRAGELFSAAVEKCASTQMIESCAYWKALVQEKMGSMNEAADSYQYVVNRYDHTYYAYRAREKLIKMGKEVRNFDLPVATIDDVIHSDRDSEMPVFYEEPLPFEPGVEETQVVSGDSATVRTADIKDHFRKYTELMSMGFFDEAGQEATILIEASPADKKMSAKLALATANFSAGKVRESIAYAEILCNSSIMSGTFRDLPNQTWQLAYPKGYFKHVAQYASQFGIDEYLVLAVIREESRFNPKTVSWASAHGLMQIIPSTGLSIARTAGIKPYNVGKLHDPETNIKMGCYYLASLLKRFDGNKILALAAYNGGPLRVKKWYARWQADVGLEVDMDEFVESIPLSETRRYVQKVMKSYNEYKRIYSNKYPTIQIKG